LGLCSLAYVSDFILAAWNLLGTGHVDHYSCRDCCVPTPPAKSENPRVFERDHAYFPGDTLGTQAASLGDAKIRGGDNAPASSSTDGKGLTSSRGLSGTPMRKDLRQTASPGDGPSTVPTRPTGHFRGRFGRDSAIFGDDLAAVLTIENRPHSPARPSPLSIRSILGTDSTRAIWQAPRGAGERGQPPARRLPLIALIPCRRLQGVGTR
jgi:hypothetical protein